MQTGGAHLSDFIQKKMKKATEPVTDSPIQFAAKPPKSKVTKALLSASVKKIKLGMINPIELARQLAIRDNRLHKKIKLEECLLLRWTKTKKDELAPAVIFAIRQFCNIGYWIAGEILKEFDLEKRVDLLQLAISAAYESLKLNNFNGSMAIVSGLQNHSIFRLKETWKELNEKSWQMWDEMQEAFKCDKNFAALRSLTSSCVLPAVPYLGMYLSDLTFIDNEDNFVTDELSTPTDTGTSSQSPPSLINFVKMTYITAVIKRIQIYQNSSYTLYPVDILQEYLLNLPVKSENDLYELSQLCEGKFHFKTGSYVKKKDDGKALSKLKQKWKSRKGSGAKKPF